MLSEREEKLIRSQNNFISNDLISNITCDLFQMILLNLDITFRELLIFKTISKRWDDEIEFFTIERNRNIKQDIATLIADLESLKSDNYTRHELLEITKLMIKGCINCINVDDGFGWPGQIWTTKPTQILVNFAGSAAEKGYLPLIFKEDSPYVFPESLFDIPNVKIGPQIIKLMLYKYCSLFVMEDFFIGLGICRYQGDPFHRSMNFNLQAANLEGAILFHSPLVEENTQYYINFTKANLKGANLRNSQFKFCCFDYANLQFADLSGAILSSCSITDAKLDNANLCGADFKPIILLQAASITNLKLMKVVK